MELQWPVDRDHLDELAAKLAKDAVIDEWRAWGVGELVPGVAVTAGFARDENGRYILTAAFLSGGAVTSDTLRRVPVVVLENAMNIGHDAVRDDVDQLPPLRRTREMSSEDFSRLVAEHYKVWARGVPHPVAAMAADANAKLPTVHTWVREARLRGLLPAAKRRKSSNRVR